MAKAEKKKLVSRSATSRKRKSAQLPRPDGAEGPGAGRQRLSRRRASAIEKHLRRNQVRRDFDRDHSRRRLLPPAHNSRYRPSQRKGGDLSRWREKAFEVGRRYRCPGPQSEPIENGDSAAKRGHQDAMKSAQGPDHRRTRPRWGVHSLGGPCRRIQRASIKGHKATTPGTMRSRKPQVPSTALGSMRFTPRATKGTAKRKPSAE